MSNSDRIEKLKDKWDLNAPVEEKKKTRADRRSEAERVKAKRAKTLECVWDRKLTTKEKGKLKKSNFSCGCGLCKPWKKNGNNKTWANKTTHSERKRRAASEDQDS